MTPLTLWYGPSVSALSLGMPVQADDAFDQFDALAAVARDGKASLTVVQEFNVKNKKNDVRGTVRRALIHDRTAETPYGRFGGAALIDSSDWAMYSVDDGEYHVAQRTHDAVGQVAYEPVPWIAVGAGMESRADGNDAMLALRVSPDSNADFTFRSYRPRHAFVAAYTNTERDIAMDLAAQRRVNAVGVQFRGGTTAGFALEADANSPRDLQTELWWKTPEQRARLRYGHTEKAYLGEVELDAQSAGRVDGLIRIERMQFEYTRNVGLHQLHAGVVRTIYDIALGGNVVDDELIDLWAYLLPGERRFIADYGVDMMQWYLAFDFTQSAAWSIRSGVQYVDIDATSRFEHWTPIPLLGIGKLDVQLDAAAVNSSRVAAIGVGGAFRATRWTLDFGLAQLVPLASGRETQRGDAAQPVAARATDRVDVVNSRGGKRVTRGGTTLGVSITWSL